MMMHSFTKVNILHSNRIFVKPYISVQIVHMSGRESFVLHVCLFCCCLNTSKYQYKLILPGYCSKNNFPPPKKKTKKTCINNSVISRPAVEFSCPQIRGNSFRKW